MKISNKTTELNSDLKREMIALVISDIDMFLKIATKNTAKKMLSNGISMSLIKKITGLNSEEIFNE